MKNEDLMRATQGQIIKNQQNKEFLESLLKNYEIIDIQIKEIMSKEEWLRRKKNEF